VAAETVEVPVSGRVEHAMSEIEITIVALDAHARKDDDLAANDGDRSLAPFRRCDRSEFKNGAHATPSEIEPVN
jgi:uncharacterized protein YhfF